MELKTKEEILAAIAKLTPQQRDVFGRICCNDDTGISKKMGDSLVKTGLVIKTEIIGDNSQGSLSWARYDFAGYFVHMIWCEFCSTLVAEELI